MYPIDDKYFILLGGLDKNDGGKFGFFQYNLSNQELKSIHIISEYTISDFPKLELQYEGKFHKNGNNIVYINKKSSNVWVFENWKLFKHFQTKDKTPLPQIIKQGDLFSYQRGETYNANADFYIHNKNIYIFSCRNKNKNQIVIDCYSFDGIYKNSFILPFKEFSQSLMNVYTKDDLIVLSFISKLIIYKQH